MGLFVFSMCGLVLANNFLLLVAFWEGVGLCSYLLVGYYYEKPSAAAAARRRSWSRGSATSASSSASSCCGDRRLAHRPDGALRPHREAPAGPGDAHDRVPAAVLRRGRQERPVPAVRLAAGRDGRPDAGLGADPRRDDGDGRRLPARPLCARCSRCARRRRSSVAWIGGITALLAAFIALTQTDLKRVLAYSTVSQLGYMFMALGTRRGDQPGVRGDRRDVPPVHARVLQGAAVPRRPAA